MRMGSKRRCRGSPRLLPFSWNHHDGDGDAAAGQEGRSARRGKFFVRERETSAAILGRALHATETHSLGLHKLPRLQRLFGGLVEVHVRPIVRLPVCERSTGRT